MEAYTYKATVVSVYDGDTFHAIIDQGLGITNGFPKGILVRLNGCNARELSDKPGGPAARDNLAAMLPAGTVVTMRSVSWDKYGGRVDAQVELPDGRDLVSVLVEEGWAAAWDGVGTRPIPAYPPVPVTTTPGAELAPADWLRRFLSLPRDRQTDVADAVLHDSRTAARCFEMDHAGAMAQLEDLHRARIEAARQPDDRPGT